MDPASIAIILSLVGLVTAGVSYFSQKDINKASTDIAKDNREFERQAILENTKLQQEYNDPQAQVRRLRAAGLNPAQLNGQSLANTLSPLPKPSTQMPNLLNPAKAFEGLENIFGQTLLQASESKKSESQTTSIDIQNELDKASLSDNINYRHAVAVQAEKQVSLLAEDIKRSQEQGTLNAEELNIKKQEIIRLSEQTALLKVQTEAAEIGIELTDQQIKDIKLAISKKQQEIDLLNKQNDWFTTDKIVGYISSLGRAAAEVVGVGKVGKYAKKIIGTPAQKYIEQPQWSDPSWYDR